MDGVTLQKRIYTGYGKAARNIGTIYNVYRAASPINPIAAGNLVAAIPVAFSAGNSFEAPVNQKTADRYLWADGQQLRQFDYLVGAYGTFYIGAMQPILPILGIQCNNIISIVRPGYSTSGSIIAANTTIALGLPVFIQLRRIEVKSPAFGAMDTGTAVTQWDAFIPVAQDSIKQHDIITDQAGTRFEIDATDYSEVGYIVRMRLAQA